MRKVYIATAAGLLLVAVLVWFAPLLTGAAGARAWILRLALLLLALVAATAVVWFFLQKQKAGGGAGAPAAGAGPGAAAGDTGEIDGLIREAESRLAAARQGRIGTLPAIFLIGESGTTKTSTMVNSGLEPELLAGRTHQDGSIVPTAAANLWFSRRVVFAEFGGPLVADDAKWKRLLSRLRPSGSLGQGRQAPRAALVCFDADTLVQADAAENCAAVARGLRARLGQIADALGISLPTYVLFTRMDRVAFFSDYAQNLTNEEAAQVLGVTLPIASQGGAATRSEQEAALLHGAFDELVHSLADARPWLLARENAPARLPGIYEFPREFRKLRGTVVQVLGELCRSSQLAKGPFLRGFYFSGVRPVVISAPIQAPRAAERPLGSGGVGDATEMFRAGVRPQQAAAAPQAAGTRKVPQWVFLNRLFQEILLQDRAAMGASATSARVDVVRRMLLAAAIAVCLVLSIGFIVSYAHNRALENRIGAAAAANAAADASALNVASADALRRLESLRQSLEVLATYDRQGPPWSYRWGLYAGDGLYPQVRFLYWQRFRQLLLAQSQNGLLDDLRRLPATPGPDYGPTYDTLKAYLITTSNHEKSNREFLAPVLLNRWKLGRDVDPERLQLAQKQFEFYSDELKLANPYSAENDGAAVEKARRYLAQFAGVERVYRAMLAEAARGSQPVNFNKRFPGSAQVVLDGYEVAGPFTKSGWDFMKTAIHNPDRYFSGEQWVLGNQVTGSIDPARLEQDLQNRYYADFVEQWRAYLRSAALVKYANLADAAQKLNLLSGNQSPLLALFWLASQNTAVDAPQVTAALQPIHAVVPPASVDRYIAQPNQNYMNALVTLQTSVDAAASAPPPADAAAAQTVNTATAARVATRQLAQTFRIDPDGHLESVAEKLLTDPITNTEALVRQMGPAELNGKGKALCAQMRSLWTKYPFKPNATAQASIPEVNAVFHKPDGALWSLYESSLQKLLVKQGAEYAQPANATVKLNPAFVSFFNQAAALSDAFYAGGTPDPHLAFTLRFVPTEGIQSAGVTVDGKAVTFDAMNVRPVPFTWNGPTAREARASIRFGNGPDLTWFTSDGTWALFRLFGRAERTLPAGNALALDWLVRTGNDPNPLTLPGGRPLTIRFELDTGGAPPVFQQGYLARLACVAELTK